MLRIAVLGAGRIGHIHARNVARNPKAELVGIYDPEADAAGELAASLGVAAISEEQAFAADAVLIASPTPTHADSIERAAAAGRAIFCEKPVDLTVARVRDCLAAAGKAGVPLMIGFNRRFDPTFAALRRRLADGEIGQPEMVVITSRDPAPPPISYIKESGGLFRDMMIHDFDMARFLLAEDPVEVYAVGTCRVDPAIGAAGDYDTAMVTLRTASGTTCQINNSRRTTYGYDQRIEVFGSAGMLRAGNQRATTVEHAGLDGFVRERALHFFLERFAEAYRLELDAFVDAVTSGRAPAPTGADGLAALTIADAATQSARTGKPVAL